MKSQSSCIALSPAPDVTLYHRGPPLDFGPLPSIFYFALSGPDSLCLDPYNQPIEFLSGKMIRAFSLTLPAHEEGLAAKDAMQVWADDLSKGIDSIQRCLDQIQIALDFVIQSRFADPEKIGIAGLSRGGLIAAFAAADEPRFRYILAFAPVTKLSLIKEFHPIQDVPLVSYYDSMKIAPKLAGRRVRIYIGNHDTRVSTDACFEWAMSLVQESRKLQPSTAPIDLILSPSIGAQGHGTSPEIFQAGAQWLSECLTHHG